MRKTNSRKDLSREIEHSAKPGTLHSTSASNLTNSDKGVQKRFHGAE